MKKLKTVQILGKEYDLSDSASCLELMDKIDECEDRCASGDLSMICYSLLSKAAM